MTDSKDTKSTGRKRASPARPRRDVRKVARAAEAAPDNAARDLALVVAGAALEKKALAVEILDVRGKVDYADFLVLMTGRSARQVDALAQTIEEACEKRRKRA